MAEPETSERPAPRVRLDREVSRIPRTITLTGPSGCGKSTVVKGLLACANDQFAPRLTSKFTTRPGRSEDGSEVMSVDEIPTDCDLAYEHAGVRYAQRTSDAIAMLAEGFSPLLILSDVRSVSDVRRNLGPNVLSLYVYRETPSREKLLDLAAQRGARVDEYERRFEKARSAYGVYLANIGLFDYVVLNAHGITWTQLQLRGIVRAVWPTASSIHSHPEESA